MSVYTNYYVNQSTIQVYAPTHIHFMWTYSFSSASSYVYVTVPLAWFSTADSSCDNRIIVHVYIKTNNRQAHETLKGIVSVEKRT